MLAHEQTLFTKAQVPYKRARMASLRIRRAQQNRSRIDMTQPKHDADIAFIKALAELLRENDLTELQVKRDYGDDGNLKVRVSRAAPAPIMMAAPVAAPVAALAPGAPAAPALTDAPSDPASHPGAVTSPMVGTV